MLTLTTQTQDGKICFTLCSEDVSSVKNPTETTLVIDVSGSMGITADTGTENSGLSVLDLVKHGANTIINTMKSDDKIAIIAFSASAYVVSPMTSDKNQLLEAVKKLEPTSTTNIYDAFTLARKTANTSSINVNKAILFLTDGDPNNEPPRGTVPQFEKDLEDSQMENIPFTTFVFGYNAKIYCMDSAAKLTNGSYVFIPDANFIGTAFINALANIMTNDYKNCVLSVSIDDLNEGDFKLHGNMTYTKTKWGLSIPIGNLRFGQARHVVLSTTKEIKESRLSAQKISTNELFNIENSVDSPRQNVIMVQYFRAKCVEVIESIFQHMVSNNLVESNAILTLYIDEIKEYLKGKSKHPLKDHLEGILGDFEGQVKEAIIDIAAWNKWGEKYLPSLKYAHSQEQCNNFKDVGVQFYGGDMFKDLQDKLEKVFVSLPPPQPSMQNTTFSRSFASSKPVANSAPIDMGSFMDRTSVCFDGNGIVAMADGTQKLVKDINKGDKVIGGTIETVIRTKSVDGKMQYCKTASGMLITEYHPIKVDNKWVFPIDLYDSSLYNSEYMYSFLLEKEKILIKVVPTVNKSVFNCLSLSRKMNASIGDKYEEIGVRPKTMVINNTEVLTLAHNIKNDRVASHEFFGTEKVVNTLMKCKGFANGLVTFQSGPGLFSRDETVKVCDINVEFEI